MRTHAVLGTPDRWFPALTRAGWREVAWPREHGSWSLALEPLALGLLAAPSAAGAGLALATLGGFLARRPLRLALTDPDAGRRSLARSALAVCAGVAAAGVAWTLAQAGPGWLPWLAPTLAAGAVFLAYDFRREGRAEVAELAGVTAFGLLPAALAVLGGATPARALALAVLMLGRSVPTVLVVRDYLRAGKTGRRRVAPGVFGALGALAWSVALWSQGLAASAAALVLGVLALRAVWLLVIFPAAWPARRLGLIEAVFGLVFVVTASLAA